MTMAAPQPPNAPDELAPLHLDSRRRAQLEEILEFVSTLCRTDQIEPLRFRIDPRDVQRLFRMVHRASFEMTLLLSRADLLRLETIVDAAGTHAIRKDPPGMPSVEPDDCWELIEWLGQADRVLFTRDERVH